MLYESAGICMKFVAIPVYNDFISGCRFRNAVAAEITSISNDGEVWVSDGVRREKKPISNLFAANDANTDKLERIRPLLAKIIELERQIAEIELNADRVKMERKYVARKTRKN